MGQIDSVSCSPRLLPQDTGSLCPASFLVESFYVLQSAAKVWPLRLRLLIPREPV